MTCVVGTPRSHKFGVTVVGAFDATNSTAATSAFRMISSNLSWNETYSQDPGHNGTPWYASEGVTLDSQMGAGNVVMQPRADNLRVILPLLVGGTFATDVLVPPVAGLCDYFKAVVDKKIGVFNFQNSKTAQWSLSSSKSQPKLQLDWGIESCDYATGAAGSFPSGLTYSTLQPFVHTSTTMTIDGTEVPLDDVTITGNNNLTTDYAFNSVTRIALPSGRQEFSFTCTAPFTDMSWFSYGRTSVAAQMVYTAGAVSLTIDFPAVHPVVNTPQTPSGETPVKHEGVVWTARTVGGVGDADYEPIKFTLDDTV